MPGKPNYFNYSTIFNGNFRQGGQKFAVSLAFINHGETLTSCLGASSITNTSESHQNCQEFETFGQTKYRRMLHIFVFLLITRLPHIHLNPSLPYRSLIAINLMGFPAVLLPNI